MSVPRDAFVAAMRNVAATVTVVTTDGPAGPRGATVSAFSSLSADPPSVLVCLNAGSRIARSVSENGVFTVNILPEEASELAQRFAGSFDHISPDRFAGLPMTHSDTGPILPNAMALGCRLQHAVSHGSHIVCIGNVLSINSGHHSPLTYLQGAFHVVRPQPNFQKEI